MSSQENSSSLKAGNTKIGGSKMGILGSNISKKGFRDRLKGPITGTKTSQSQIDSNFVVVDGIVRTPKDLITQRYREYTEQYLKLLQNQHQLERKAKQQIDNKVKSSLNSHNDSEMKGSSSNLRENSQFMSSSKSEVDSETQSKKQRQLASKKDPKALTIQDLQKNIPIQLEQTQTIITFHLPSTCFKQDNDDMKLKNRNYREYMQKRIGSDNYIARPVQTFNFQHKKIAESVERRNTNETGVFASAWDIEDIMKLEKKTQFQVLQEDLKSNVDKEFSQLLTNPFSCLSLQKQSIEIHSKFPVPGAAEYFLKAKDNDKNSRSKKHGLASGNTGLAQISTTNNNRHPQSRQNDSSRKKDSSQGNSNSRKGARAAQAQMQFNLQQQKVQDEEKQLLDKLMNRAKQMPSEQQRKLMANENLEKMLKYVDRILNSQTYHREYIMYRNYPEIEFTKRSPEDELGRNFKKKKQQTKKEQIKDPLQYLFSFQCKILEGFAVTSADWNPVNQDLLAVTYEIIEKDNDGEKQGINKGYLMFWTLKNPAFPEKIFSSESRITSCKFSQQNPNLIACGTHDGIVAIYDIRKKDNKPIAENKQSMDKNTNAIWDIQWISKGKGNKGESLVSISTDGRITEWSMKKGLQYTDLMLLKRVAPSNKKDAIQNMNFRFAAGLSFQFLKNQSSMYLATTEQGVIYRCSKSYTQQSLEVYLGHNGPIYKVRSNPFFHDIFLTCSADWSCKLWNWRQDQPLFSFQSLDLTDQVTDIEWSPQEATVFASVCKDGRLELWDLQKKNMLDPISIIKGNKPDEKAAPKTLVRFCRGAPVLITGDMNGDINVYRLNRDEQNIDPGYQAQKLSKLVYPNGYKLGNTNQQTQEQKKEQEN